MLSIFKKKKPSIEGKQKSINIQELDTSATDVIDTEEEISPELVILPSMNIPKEKEYVLRFLNSELESLKPNQLNITGVEITETDTTVEVSAFFRNSLKKKYNVGTRNLLLLDNKGNAILQSDYDFSQLGEIEPCKSYFWAFIFSKADLLTDEFDVTNFSLEFNLLPDNELILPEHLDTTLSVEQKEKLYELNRQLPKYKLNQLNFIPLEMASTNNGIVFSIFAKNTYLNDVTIEQLPFDLFDANNTLFAKCSYQTSDLVLKSNSTTILTFPLLKEMIVTDEVNLSTWNIRIR